MNSKIIIMIMMLASITLALPFSATWNTSKAGTNTGIALPLENGGTYNFTADWGDGNTTTVTAWNSTNATHVYATNGTYTVNITGTIIGFRFNNAGDKLKILDIKQWGDLRLGNNNAYFYGCSNLNSTATDALNLTGTTDLYFMFRDASAFNGNISNWNTSSVTTLRSMFGYASSFNQPIGTWNTSSVTNMAWVFGQASAFNQPIENWDTSKVTRTDSMFYYASAFNQDVSGWNVSAVTTMDSMFYLANLSTINYDLLLNGWLTKGVKNNVIFNAGSTKYSVCGGGNTSRAILTGTYNWTIADGGIDNSTCTTIPETTYALDTRLNNELMITANSGADWYYWNITYKINSTKNTNVTYTFNITDQGSNYDYAENKTAEGTLNFTAYENKTLNYYFRTPAAFYQSTVNNISAGHVEHRITFFAPASVSNTFINNNYQGLKISFPAETTTLAHWYLFRYNGVAYQDVTNDAGYNFTTNASHANWNNAQNQVSQSYALVGSGSVTPPTVVIIGGGSGGGGGGYSDTTKNIENNISETYQLNGSTGQTQTIKFYLENKETSSVSISYVTTSTGLKLTPSTKTLAPGEKAVFTLQVTLPQTIGSSTKQIEIRADGQAWKTITTEISVDTQTEIGSSLLGTDAFYDFLSGKTENVPHSLILALLLCGIGLKTPKASKARLFYFGTAGLIVLIFSNNILEALSITVN